MLGVVVAVMRLSPNPVLLGVAWLYTWFFRAVPRLVLAILFGNLGILWAAARVRRCRSTGSSAQLFGIDDFERAARSASTRATLLTGFVAGLLALGAVRGRVHGRDRPGRHPVGRQGQTEAAAGARA